jgi:integrase
MPIRYQDEINKTLTNARNEGKAETTIKSFEHRLKQLTKATDLKNPAEVKTVITHSTLCESSKASFSLAYSWFAKTNGIQWEQPKFKWNETTPIIPSTDSITKIISASTKRYATIFTLMAEIGIEGEELHRLHRNKIDTERGIVSVTGTKGHDSNTYKLKPHTAEMLREYLARNPEDHPFPKPKIMGEIWRRVRKRVAENLKQPELLKIPMKNLRNYSGAMLYLSLPIRDPIAVMRHLRHKKLDTTMHYLRGITLTYDEDDQWISLITKTPEEECKAIEKGYQLVRAIDQTTAIYRKRK